MVAGTQLLSSCHVLIANNTLCVFQCQLIIQLSIALTLIKSHYKVGQWQTLGLITYTFAYIITAAQLGNHSQTIHALAKPFAA